MLNRIVLSYGGPGSGKDTLAKYLSTYHNWGHASMSHSLRQVDEAFPLLGVMDTIDRGGIVNLDIVMSAYQLKLAEFSLVPPSNGNLFFQGVFRSLEQVRPQLELATRYAKNVLVLKLDLGDEEMISRILKRNEGRADDDEFTARQRIDLFRHSEKGIDKRLKGIAPKHPKVSYVCIGAGPPIDQVSWELMRVALAA